MKKGRLSNDWRSVELALNVFRPGAMEREYLKQKELSKLLTALEEKE